MSAFVQALKHELNLYAAVRIHNRPYVVTKGDLVHLPFNLKTASVGDRLRINAIDTVGSRNVTWNGDVAADRVLVEAVVVDKSRAPMTVKEVTKRRQRHVKHIQNKPAYTTLRVSELRLLD